MPYYTMPDAEALFVRVIGQGQPVLVLSGLGMQSWQWIPFLLPNLNQYQFIIPDWRGFGGSKHCKIPQDLDAIQNHWRDIAALIQQLQLNDFILIGYSMGATTAMHGMQYGDLHKKLKAYLHIDQSPKIPSDDYWEFGLLGKKYDQLKQLLNDLSILLHQYKSFKLVQDLPKEARNQLLQLWSQFIKIQTSNKISSLLFNFALKQPQLQKHLLPIQRIDYMTWYIDNYLNHDEDYRATIANLNCQATFFIGEKSHLYPADGQKIIAESPKNANSILFKRSGHAPLISEPIKFGREIQIFLENSV